MNREEQRKKLMELLDEALRKWLDRMKENELTESSTEFVVDHLLSHNVRVLPCNLGDQLWYISTENPYVAFEKELKARQDNPVQGILIAEDGVYIVTDDINRVKQFCSKVGEDYAYLTEEDAYAEIKKLEEKIENGN